jgi:large subunit ribosomal protein L30
MYAAIRIRGNVDLSPKINDTMKILKLTKSNHLVLVKDGKESRGMLERARDYITYGEIERETMRKLIEKRGRVEGDRRINSEFLKEKGLEGIGNVAEEIEKGKRLRDFGIKEVFRLSPPKRGFERAGIKKSYCEGGVLGYRGAEINKLIMKMI